MFYCEKCQKKNNWPDSLAKSSGRCEICGEDALCNDVPSSELSTSKNESKRGYKPISVIKYLLFHFDDVSEDIGDISELSNEKFEEYAKRKNGHIFNSKEDFEAAFNSEKINTATHQLRIT